MSSRIPSLKTVKECLVCAEPATKIACCPFCEYSSCRSCAQTYILGEGSAKCMNCRKEWSREIQIRELTQTFVNGPLKKHMENVIFDSQRVLMPETLEEYERDYKLKHARKAYDVAYKNQQLYLDSIQYYEQIELYETLRAEVNGLERYMADADQEKYTEKTSEFAKMQKKIHEIHNHPKYIALEQDLKQKLDTLRNVRESVHNLLEKTKNTQATTQPRFIRACPADNCRGFLSPQWKCGLCDLATCSECLTVLPKGSAHACNPDVLASAKMMAKDTKPCPKCASSIFKIDGCDQMWCTMCKTAFSWKTGEIETRVIHNPHFFEYQRKNNAGMARNIGDMPCGRELDVHNMNYMRGIITSKNMDETIMVRIHDYMRAASHLQMVVLPTYRPDRVVNFRMLRLKYIASEITDAEFRARLVRDMKKHDKNIEIGQVLQMLSITLHELLFRFIEEIKPVSPSEIHQSLGTLDEIDRLYEYANICLFNISKVYGSAPIGVRVMDPYSLTEPIHYGTGIYSLNVQKKSTK